VNERTNELMNGAFIGLLVIKKSVTVCSKERL